MLSPRADSGGGGPGSGGFRKRKHDNFPHNQRREGKDVNSSSPVMLAFKSFQQELDARHDKYERLVKLSRDITVESKRTIFLLHRITSAPDMEEILTESEVKLDGVRQKILQVAQELSVEDMHQFHRAITTGRTSLHMTNLEGLGEKIRGHDRKKGEVKVKQASRRKHMRMSL
uniref:Translin associated factor X n=1 Tax=Bos mutus grunniens TaxID=30521 RepID=A0A8B9XZ88_BOSMU